MFFLKYWKPVSWQQALTHTETMKEEAREDEKICDLWTRTFTLRVPVITAEDKILIYILFVFQKKKRVEISCELS